MLIAKLCRNLSQQSQSTRRIWKRKTAVVLCSWAVQNEGNTCSFPPSLKQTCTCCVMQRQYRNKPVFLHQSVKSCTIHDLTFLFDYKKVKHLEATEPTQGRITCAIGGPERSCDRNKSDLSLHQPRNLSAAPSIYRPAVSALSCAAVKFSPSQAPSDLSPDDLR